MADYSAIKAYLSSQNLNYFTFYPKSLKLIKAVIRHLPENTPAEEIYEGLVEIGFYIISVKQMSTTRQSHGPTSTSLTLFLIALPRSEKSQEIFKLTIICYIAITVELYKLQSQFGHVWALQATSPLPVVWRRPSTQGTPGEGQGRFNTGLLQL
jgi:hypothetical protein